jgi:hypothetical protein
MTATSTLSNIYQYLTAEERFRLVLAAAARGDFAERDPLSQSSKLVPLQVQDYRPWAEAFTELATTIFMEMVEIAHRHRETIREWVDVAQSVDRARAKEEKRTGKRRGFPDHGEMTEDEELELELLRGAFGTGFILKTKIAGWKSFCDRMNMPAFTIWEFLPGYERLEKAMTDLDETKNPMAIAFSAEEMLGFLKNIRPEGFAEPTADGLISAEAVADGLRQMLRDGVKQHGG